MCLFSECLVYVKSTWKKAINGLKDQLVKKVVCYSNRSFIRTTFCQLHENNIMSIDANYIMSIYVNFMIYINDIFFHSNFHFHYRNDKVV